MSDPLDDEITLLSAELLQSDRERAEEFRALAQELRIPLGWHYLLDLIWASRRVEPELEHGTSVLDAGAGLGLMQWWLARRGARVLSVDRVVRDVPRRLRAAARVRGLNGGDLPPLRPGVGRLVRAARLREPLAVRARAAAGVVRDLVLGEPAATSPGEVIFHRTSLDDLPAVPRESIDTVVSISALEHNAPERLAAIVNELLRVLRPGGRLIATLPAAQHDDWYHEPSSGWCYTESTLRRVFRLDRAAPSNFGDWDRLFALLRESSELRMGLADFYFRSENSGMPGGRWDPRYQPAGLVKVKRS